MKRRSFVAAVLSLVGFGWRRNASSQQASVMWRTGGTWCRPPDGDGYFVPEVNFTFTVDGEVFATMRLRRGGYEVVPVKQTPLSDAEWEAIFRAMKQFTPLPEPIRKDLDELAQYEERLIHGDPAAPRPKGVIVAKSNSEAT